MENYELHIDTSPRINRVNGQFLKGHRPFNKGMKQKEFMDGRKIKKVLKYLELGRKNGNPGLAGHNSKPVVGIKDGKIIAFKSSIEAAKILKARGIKVNSRNIRIVCQGKEQIVKYGEKQYKVTRRKAGDFLWYFENDVDKYKDLVK